MIRLAPTFHEKERFDGGEEYRLLPFQFLRLDPHRYLLTNIAGEFIVLPELKLLSLIAHKLAQNDESFADLEARHFLSQGGLETHMELMAAQYRTRQSRLSDLMGLHIFVVTLRCDHSCQYCQVSRVSDDRRKFDMSIETADKAIDLMFKCPSPCLKIEFQGGEPLLNFPLIKHIVERCIALNDGRLLQFVVATNLSVLTDEMLDFFAAHQVLISTSLDGPEELHNHNRPRPERDAYARTINGIERCRKWLGAEAVSALMTCTAESLDQPEAIIDEYVRHGFREIFLRHISPYGFAVKTVERIGYETERFLQFYRLGLAHILKLNRQGMPFREIYSAILLRRILTPYATGYVNLRSPAGLGLATLVYNYDGDIYGSDEGRMLAEMGDEHFRLGNVQSSSWESLFHDSPLLEISHSTMTEGIPGCCDCALQPYCGSDPDFHYVTQRDLIGHRPSSAFCRRNMEMMRHLITLLEDDPSAARILKGWAQ